MWIRAQRPSTHQTLNCSHVRVMCSDNSPWQTLLHPPGRWENGGKVKFGGLPGLRGDGRAGVHPGGLAPESEPLTAPQVDGSY